VRPRSSENSNSGSSERPNTNESAASSSGNGTNNNSGGIQDNTSNESQCENVPTVKLNTNSLVIKKGNTVSTVVASLENDTIDSVESSNEKIAKVTKVKNGRLYIKGIKTGKTKIKIKTSSGLTTVLNVKVQNKKVVSTKLKTSKKKVTLKAPKDIATVKVTATPDYYSTKQKIKAKSSNKKVATVKINPVTGELVITAKKKGECKITVSAGSKKADISVKVSK
jgi:hypothetical protein